MYENGINLLLLATVYTTLPCFDCKTGYCFLLTSYNYKKACLMRRSFVRIMVSTNKLFFFRWIILSLVIQYGMFYSNFCLRHAYFNYRETNCYSVSLSCSFYFNFSVETSKSTKKQKEIWPLINISTDCC